MKRVALIGGCRTPFVKAGAQLSRHSFIDLGVAAVKALVEKLRIVPQEVNELVFGTVLLDPRAPNFARELVLRSGLSEGITAHSVSNNCISGLVAMNVVAEGIKTGRLQSGIAGGSESMSRPALALRQDAEAFFIKLTRAKTLKDRVTALKDFRPNFIVPLAPSPKEPSTGLTMGEHCELMAKEFSIPRLIQDEIALRSHHNAARAQAEGFLSDEIVAVDGITKDTMIRGDTSLDKLQKLPPVFDRTGSGTLTAGNSSPLTDGASAVYLTSEERARSEGREILAFVEGVSFAAIPPRDGLLMAPCLAVPELLHRHQLTVGDIDLFEIHEAFGAQVAANLEVWKNGWKKRPDMRPIGDIPIEKINVNGSSIAIGHPFAATGGRILTSLGHELKRRNAKRGVISICAAGGMAGAVLLTREG